MWYPYVCFECSLELEPEWKIKMILVLPERSLKLELQPTKNIVVPRVAEPGGIALQCWWG